MGVEAPAPLVGELKGDVRLTDVDFGYEEGKPVLHDVTVWAEPGQKVAFVEATGAGKTTNNEPDQSFLRYRGRKDPLRRNKYQQDKEIRPAPLARYRPPGDEPVHRNGHRRCTPTRRSRRDRRGVSAANTGADDFITRLPGGYSAELTNNGANLSQGQRQLIAIARAGVAVSAGHDSRRGDLVDRHPHRESSAEYDAKLMEGRTVVIAHRLSSMNSDVIMVLDHGRRHSNHEKLIAEKGTYYQLYTGAFELE